MQPLDRLFRDTLQDVYYAELTVTAFLGRVSTEAQSPRLVNALRLQTDHAAAQMRGLDEVFVLVGERYNGRSCPAIDGIVEHATTQMKNFRDSRAIDPALGSATRALQTYEIARLDELLMWAMTLGHNGTIQLFQEILDEKKAADIQLEEIDDELSTMSIVVK